MYCLSEICIAAQNIYCHSEICYPDGRYTFANHHYTTVQYGHRPTKVPWITASYRPHVLLPSSYTEFSPCATTCTHPAKSFELAQNFRRVSPTAKTQKSHQRVHRSLNAPQCALTVFHRLHEIYHTVAHGRLSRYHVTAT